jgi:hypothetical protein
MHDRGGGGLPRAGRRAKAPESGRMAAGEGSERRDATLGLVRIRDGLGMGSGSGVLDSFF